MHVKKSTILFSVQFIITVIFTSQSFCENLPRNVNDLPNRPYAHTQNDSNCQEKFSEKTKAQIAEQVELLKQKRAQFVVEQNSKKQFSVEELYSIIEYARALKFTLRKALTDKFLDAKGTLSAHGRRIRSYVFTPAAQRKIDEILVTEQGMVSLPNIHKAHAAIPLAGGFIAGAAVPIVAAVRSTVGGNDSGPSVPLESTKKAYKNPQEQKKDTKLNNSSPVQASIALNGSKLLSNSGQQKAANSSQAAVQNKSKPVQNRTSFNISAQNDSSTIKKTTKNNTAFVPSDSKAQVIKDFEARKIHDQEKRDHVINTVASTAVVGLQQYDQQQKDIRIAKKTAQWEQEKENDIQRRMRLQGKSRWQIEEEDRLLLEKLEQNRTEEARHKQEEEKRQNEEKKKKKSQPIKNQRQSDVSRTSNSGPEKDPDDDDPKKQGSSAVAAASGKVAVDEVKKTMKYTGNPKHHINSKGAASKPPHNGQKTLERSELVRIDPRTGLSDRVATENGKIIKFHEHAPDEFHGYIEENVKQMDEAYKKALYKAGLIKSIKSCKVKK